MPKKKWTSRRIARDIVILLMVLTIAVLAPVSYLASQARQDISEHFIHNAANQAVSQFRTMNGSMEATLGLVRDWGASGALPITNIEELQKLLFPIFGREKLLYGISIADIEGTSMLVQRTEEGFRSSLVSDEGKKRMSEVTYWTPDFKMAETYSTNSIYDPRNRPWFAPALAQEGIFWTDPYTFFTTGDIGITASTSYLREKGNMQVVIAFDVLLDDLFQEMHQLSPSDNSEIFIFRRDAHLYIPEGEDLKAAFIPMGEAGNELVSKVHSFWLGDNELIDNVISIMHNGQNWWCGFRPLDADRKSTWIAVMVPESDILGHAGQRSKRLWLIGISSILLTTAMAYWMIRRYGRPSASTSVFDREDPEGSIQRIIENGENRYAEFKSTMRMNLHTQKPGKEIEMAWMKGVAGFLNTDGGILLIGVTDDGEITGLERDVFENDDKCRLHFKNLISKHIGADLSKYIRFIIVPMGGKTVGVVRCDRAEEPVFVKDGNKEHFYIRNGPSSDELPVSQALNYIKHRE
jgi:hypothetical protein